MSLTDLIRGDVQAERVVPPTGASAWLTGVTAAAMAFLAVFALALSLAASRLADRWTDTLDSSATIRISAAPNQTDIQTRIVLDLLATTPGVASARALTDDEQRALLEPWFGPDLPLDSLPVPRLIEVIPAGDGYDGAGLRQRLAAEAPGAVLDDHTRWREPLAQAASRLRLLGVLSILLILGTMGAMITLAASAALAANAEVISVLRLVGARDSYIARAFTRRFTLRTLGGAAAGTVLGLGAIAVLPSADPAGGFLTGLGFQGAGWLLPLLLPPLSAVIAFFATRAAAIRKLRDLT